MSDFIPLQLSHVLQHPFLVALLCPILSLVTYLIFTSWLANLSHIPGPFIARYTDIWAAYNARRGLLQRNNVDLPRGLQKKYGDVVRTGPCSVTVLDPAAVPTIYGVRARLDKGKAYLPFRQPGVKTSMLSIPDEKTHSQYRKLVSNAYALSSLKAYEPYVDDMVKRFVEVCDEHAETQTPMNLSLWCHYFCYDVVSKITMGQPLGAMEGQGHDPYGLIRAIKAFGNYVGVVSQMPWLHKIFVDNPLMRTARPSQFQQVIKQTVEARLRKPDPNNQPRPDLLSHFVATHQTSKLMDEKHVLVTAAGNLVAGALSPSVAFDELCQHIATCPNSQERLYQELKDAKLSLPASYDDVRDLPYLEGVIREAFRFHAPTAFNLQRVTGPAGLDLPNGVHIPPNTNIGCPMGAINQEVRVFGRDADEYNPERWMRAKEETEELYHERRTLMDRTELSFGQGSRSCIGKNVAFLEFFKAVATLFVQFEFEAARPIKKGAVTVNVVRRYPETSL